MTPCPCGQTYGTCRRHRGKAPEIATFTFVRHDGVEWWTYITRPKSMDDATWAEAQDFCANNVAKNLIDEAKKGRPAK